MGFVCYTSTTWIFHLTKFETNPRQSPLRELSDPLFSAASRLDQGIKLPVIILFSRLILGLRRRDGNGQRLRKVSRGRGLAISRMDDSVGEVT